MLSTNRDTVRWIDRRANEPPITEGNNNICIMFLHYFIFSIFTVGMIANARRKTDKIIGLHNQLGDNF